MVKIRLARFGKRKQPLYRIVATSARTKRNSHALEYLGTYDPQSTSNKIEFDKERVQYWLDNGAQPTYTVKSLFVINGFMKADIKKRPVAKAKKEVEEKSAKVEAKVEPKVEEVIEEEKVEEVEKVEEIEKVQEVEAEKAE